MRKPTVIAGVFLALHVLLAARSPICAWGGDMLAFYPAWGPVAFALVSILILAPAVRRRAIHGMAAFPAFLDPWGAPRSRCAFTLLLLLTGGAAFIALRSAVHLLGDGYLLLRELDGAVWEAAPRTDRAPLVFWIVRTLHHIGSPFWHTAGATYRLLSFASGILYLVLAPIAARILARGRLQRTVVLGFLLTPGFLQLFFGYVENYPLLFPGMLLYLLVGIQALRGRLPLWAPALLLGALVSLHFMQAALAPSLLFLAFLQLRRSGSSRWGRALKISASLALAPIVSWVILVLIGFDLPAYLGQVRGSHLLPLFAQPDFAQHYRIFSPAHLLDILNQYLLAAPSALMVLPLLFRSRAAPDPERRFTLIAAVFPMVFTFVANPEVGVFRDWDVLAFAALPLTLWAALALIGRIRERTRLAHTALLICAAAGLHSLAWIGLNADAPSAVARFSAAMERCALSAHARSYGWETLGSYYRRGGDGESALGAFRRAVDASPENPRHWLALGNRCLQMNRLTDAIDAYRRALELDPDLPDAHSNLSAVYQRQSRYDEALQHLRKAVALDPDYAEAYSNMGVVLHNLGRHEEAIRQFRKAVALRPDYIEAYSNMGLVYYRMGQPDRTRECFLQILRLDPDYPFDPAVRKWLRATP